MTAIPADTERERDLPDDQPWKRALRRLVHRRGAMIGAAVVLFFVLMAIFAPMVAPYAPIATDWAAVRKAPSWAHWLGTDEIGRDVLSRVIFGARASLLAGLVSVCISLMFGVPPPAPFLDREVERADLRQYTRTARAHGLNCARARFRQNGL